MNTNPLIMTALSNIGIPVQWMRYVGNETEYITFNDSDNRPSFFGNNEELMDIAYVQVHFFTPNNPKSTAKKIRKKLRQAGFTYLSTTEIYEETTKLFHTIIEVMIEGISETQMDDY